MIERGRTADADAVADLWVDLATDQRDHGSHLLPAENRERIRESILRHAVAGSLFLARVEGQLVGFVTCSIDTGGYAQDESRGLVENLYVVPDERGEGVGTALLEAAEAHLADQGCTTVSLDVLAANADGRRFYERHGYAPHRVELERRLDAGSDMD